MSVLAMLLAILTFLCPVEANEAMTFTFDEGPPAGWETEGCEMVEGRDGPALRIAGDARASFAAPEMLTGGFEIYLRIMHKQALSDLRFEELVYLYHDTEDLKNRICLKKRIGADEILFAMSDSGPGKGAEFAGDWYAMTAGPLDWPAGSWHHLRIIADPAAGSAQLWIDGERVASAEGAQFPEAAGTLWLGSWSGRSQAKAAFDGLTIAPVEE